MIKCSCGRPARLVQPDYVFNGITRGPQWACSVCDTTVGCHCFKPKRHKLQPLGDLADKKTITLRAKALKLFDAVRDMGAETLEGRSKTTGAAEAKISRITGMFIVKAEINQFSAKACREVIHACNKLI